MKRILLVDDEPNVLAGLRRMLHGAGEDWELEFATSGAAALLACKERGFDVVVSDLSMPGMDGAELLEHLRDEFPATTRIILSGYADPALCLRAASVARCVLKKPCGPKEFKAALAGVGCWDSRALRSPPM